ncbi:PEP-CTERM sorting domain-containing protein [Azohydromonas caseinilytica]|uniref:PEP-CTERM sorting domain-containing protein n=1 Tax=Azohydromonas caseinilytica TaxID=2728836 RepID=A0A848FCC1_9BURK|nr:PEP-CTERM sorting domain-containing protein [Azohydromonas caseinilytica]NML17857.1 PEP-CTERM sorting domain-containing protein [Azohydromonas caseinilytica]
MPRLLRLALVALLALASSLAGATIRVHVPGTSNPWLAGAPAGTVDEFDTAPFQSPVLVQGLELRGSRALSFRVTGAVANCGADSPSVICCPDCGRAFPGPDGPIAGQNGAADVFNHRPFNGLSDVRAPINSLIGVFLGPNPPDAQATPAMLDFSSAGLGRAFLSLHPELQQPFFIGDGLTGRGSGREQRFFAPEGATRLFLGTMDGAEWSNNAGAFRVQVTTVPEPSALLLTGTGLGLLVLLRRRVAGRALAN